ncbi:hypothetical protein [Diaphorobacter caeni]|uniref:hypothetical protein n=1 Tax=Diaphorobacter caeni TaxID=2784387 RepID=UPI00188E60F5|nr:hypothetical protein [Diaphorobacter caeni]MBF5006796.1 hypothetical protein [Diaphorobacter caeni]
MDILKEFIGDGILQDIIISGYIDGGAIPVFHPLYDRIYFVFSDRMVEMKVNDDSYVVFGLVSGLECWLDIDEDDKFAQMSIYNLVLKTEQNVTLDSIECENEILANVTVNFSEGGIARRVVFNPKNFFGFTFGGS